jgi:hypothetical protein
MKDMPRRTLAMTLSFTLAISASALAKGALRGKTYVGRAPTSGIDGRRHHRLQLHAGGNITLRVARNGRSVTVRFSSAHPILYCNTTKMLKVQTTKPAPISRSGAFHVSISERFAAGPGPPAIVQVVSGRFSGGRVHGTIDTRAAECSGSATFSARARGRG